MLRDDGMTWHGMGMPSWEIGMAYGMPWDWHGMVWKHAHMPSWHAMGLAWHGMEAWICHHGMAMGDRMLRDDCMAWHGMAWQGMAWHGMAWHGMG